jgi:LCP family protein required for cell wall assembly
MSRRITSLSELLLIAVVVFSLVFGVSWTGSAEGLAPISEEATPTSASVVQTSQQAAKVTTVATVAPAAKATVNPKATALPDVSTLAPISGTIGLVPTSAVMSAKVPIEPGDAPLLVQAPGTINILMLGVDASADERYSRTDTLIIASVNPEMPSVSMLSIARDTQVRIPNHADDRINTAFELGYLRNYPGGGPAFLAAVLRKNFGVRIDHYVRIDFQGFVKAVDLLGGVNVLAECELHDTFPDKTSPNGRVDIDVSPGLVSLTGKQALMYARSRYSTSDFDRARRQQKVIRALMSKAKGSNMLQNALGLYSEVRPYVDTDLGLESAPLLIDIIERLDNLAIKNRVVTYPVVKPFTRKDGAMVLLPTDGIVSYVAEALSPPAGNRLQNRTRIEVVNASGRADMQSVAAERLAWEGFTVSSATVADTQQAKTQIIDFSTTQKGSPISRLSAIFNLGKGGVSSEPDTASPVVAKIVLGTDYISCPRTMSIAGDIIVNTSDTKLIPTSTPTK